MVKFCRKFENHKEHSSKYVHNDCLGIHLTIQKLNGGFSEFKKSFSEVETLLRKGYVYVLQKNIQMILYGMI